MARSDVDTKARQLPVLQPDIKPRGRGRTRAMVLILVHLIIIAHITQFYISGRTVSPVEPSESMYALELGYLNAGTILFAVAILSTAIFGRFFCGWACHLVALQDLCSYLLGRIGIRLKPLRSRLLAFVPFAVAFYMFFWPTVKRLWQGNPHPGFTNHLMTENFWQTFPGPLISLLTFVVCGGLIVYLLGNKGFCTYACPYGAFFTTADFVAAGRIRVTDDCHQCGRCTAACTSNVFVSREVKEFGMVVDPGCMKCMDCVSVCPNDALYFGFQQKSSSANSNSADSAGSRRKTYDFSIAEELAGLIMAVVTIYALRGLYDVVPFLLSVALGVITAYLTIQFWRFFRRRDLRLQNVQIKRNGRVTSNGRWTVVLLGLWFAFVAQSFFVQHFRYRGRHHLSQIDLVWDQILVPEPSAREFNAEENANIDKAWKSFQYSDAVGLKDVYEVKLGLAATYLLKKEVEPAETCLRQAYELNPAATRDILMEFLAAQGRPQEAKAFF